MEVAERSSVVELVLVDDDADTVCEIEEHLLRRQHRCRSFTDPKAALTYLSQTPGDTVLLSDIRMPEIGGLDVVRLMRVSSSVRQVEVILFSGFGAFDDAVNALELGVADFLLKPIDLGELDKAISRSLVKISERAAQRSERETLERQMQRVNEKAKEFLAAAEALPGAAPRPPAPVRGDVQHDRLSLMKTLQTLKRVRDRALPICAGSSPHWDVLLYVYEQALLGRSVSVTSACHATDVPQTTAIRKIEEMIDAGLLDRFQDPEDRRRVLLRLAPRSRETMNAVLDNMTHHLSLTQPSRSN